MGTWGLSMDKKAGWIFVGLVAVGMTAAALLTLYASNAALLDPKGAIADEQRDLIVFTAVLSLTVVIPVYLMLFVFAWRYRAGNHRAKYAPDWDHNRLVETVWWAVPLLLISLLAVITWQSSHSLDPFKPISADAKPLRIQVVALQWKWLFIYPETGIGTINEIYLPVDRPVKFEITADAPMNSFWIPQLGGQVYAMAGMQTELNLLAGEPGSYRGSSANLSGDGFAGMTFAAHAVSSADFDRWTSRIKSGSPPLDHPTYHALAKPGPKAGVKHFASTPPDLYASILMRYMAPHHSQPSHKHHGSHH